MKTGLILALLLMLCCAPLAHAEVSQAEAFNWEYALPEASRKGLEEMLQEAGYEGLAFVDETAIDDIFPRYVLRISDNVKFIQRVTSQGQLLVVSIHVLKENVADAFSFAEADKLSRLFVRSVYPFLTDEDAGVVLSWLSKDMEAIINGTEKKSVTVRLGPGEIELFVSQERYVLRLADYAAGDADAEVFRANQ